VREDEGRGGARRAPSRLRFGIKRIVENATFVTRLLALAVIYLATAQAVADAALVQIRLTDAQVKAYAAAQPDLAAVISRLPDDLKSNAKLETIVRNHNFASLEAYKTVAWNISLIVEGIDPETKRYVGAEAVLKRQLADLETDNGVSKADKKAAAAKLNLALKAVVAVQYPENIDLVMGNLDAILATSPFGEAPSQK
jgi:hypothetical protein